MPENRTRQLLLNDSLFEPDASKHLGTMGLYHWEHLAIPFLDQYPLHATEFARKILQHFQHEGTVASSFHTEGCTVLAKAIERDPATHWNLVAEFIRIPMDVRTFNIQDWPRGSNGGGGITLFSLETLLSWVDEDIENRAWFVARVAPKLLSREGGGNLTHQLLVRYGDRKDVQDNLYANWTSGIWHGPESAHYRTQRDEFVALRTGETALNVQRWLDQMIESYNRQIEDALIREERDTH